MNQIITEIGEANLSHAWAKAFLHVMQQGIDEVPLLAVHITGFSENIPHEDPDIRAALDKELEVRGKPKCDTVANTIFPAFWIPRLGRQSLFREFYKIWPIVRQHPLNRKGTYFQRLVGPDCNNQLEHVIQIYQTGIHRRSALQASIFDPSQDHTNKPYGSFPCLQHVFFTPVNQNELALTGVYANQTLFEKAYGNYLGLCRLGHFMAYEMKLKLTRVTCLANVALRSSGNLSKAELRNFSGIIKGLVERNQVEETQ